MIYLPYMTWKVLELFYYLKSIIWFGSTNMICIILYQLFPIFYSLTTVTHNSLEISSSQKLYGRVISFVLLVVLLLVS